MTEPGPWINTSHEVSRPTHQYGGRRNNARHPKRKFHRDAQGKINVDIISYPIGQNGLLKEIDTLSFGSYTGRIKIGGIKLILDGSPQGKTAYLTEPYYKPPHSESDSYKGYPLIPQSEVSKWVQEYAELKIPIMAHANGDAAADMLIEAVEQANMNSDHRTIMIHVCLFNSLN